VFVAPADAALRIYARWNVTARGSVTHTWSLTDSTPCHANGGGTTTVSFTSSRPGKIKIADNGYGLGDFSFDGTLKLKGTITALDNRTRNAPRSADEPCDSDPTHPVPDTRWCKTVSFRDQLSVDQDANHRGRYIIDGGSFVNHLNAPDGIGDCETDGFQGFAQIYGGRNSLEIGFVATLITMVLATMIALAAGYFRGITDGVLTRLMDLIWAYPAVLLGIALGTSLALGGVNLGLFKLNGNSLLVPAVIIGVVYIPYVAKPLRGQVLGLREKEFVDAARVQGMGPLRIMASEILPNLASTIIVFVPLIIANAILLEAGLSYLGAGVQEPNPSWGTMISDGIRLIPGAIHLTLVPGAMLVLAVLGMNVFGDGVRDALDPRSKVRIEH